MTMAGNFAPLVLAGDNDRVDALAVGEYLDAWAGQDSLRLATSNAIKAILAGSGRLAGRIARGSLPGNPGKLVGVNSDQDQQKSIDVGAHNLFVELLIAAGAASVLSEEAELPVPGKSDGLMLRLAPFSRFFPQMWGSLSCNPAVARLPLVMYHLAIPLISRSRLAKA